MADVQSATGVRFHAGTEVAFGALSQGQIARLSYP